MEKATEHTLQAQNISGWTIETMDYSSRADWIITDTTRTEASKLAEIIFTEDTVLRSMTDFPKGKAPGMTEVPFECFTCLLGMPKLLLKYFRFIFVSGKVPISWTQARIVPVPKKGDLSDIGNYRPISLLEHLRKCFESCLLSYLNTLSISIQSNQGGFRSKRSTIDQALSLHETIHGMIKEDRSKKPYLCFLDIKAAYDSVPRDILWARCISRGVPRLVVERLKSLFDHQRSVLTINGKDSQPIIHEAGVQQGSLLSPWLYSLFIDDLIQTLNSNGPMVQVNESFSVNNFFYADDIALVSKKREEMQALLDICDKHSLENKYRFNVKKCVTLNNARLSLYGELLDHQKEFTYLGIPIGSHGINAISHIQQLAQKARAALAHFLKSALAWHGTSLEKRVEVFRSFIRSKMEYGLCLCNVNEKQLKPLQDIQNTALRRMLGVGPGTSIALLHCMTGLPTMAARHEVLKAQWLFRLRHLNDQQPLMIKQVVPDSTNQPDRLTYKLMWHNQLILQVETAMLELQQEQRNKCSEKELCNLLLDKYMTKLKEDLSSKYNNKLNLGSQVGKVSTLLQWTTKLTAKPKNIQRHRKRNHMAKRLTCWIGKQLPAGFVNNCSSCNQQGKCTMQHIMQCSQMISKLRAALPRTLTEDIEDDERYAIEYILSIINVKKDPEKEEYYRSICEIITECVNSCCKHEFFLPKI